MAGVCLNCGAQITCSCQKRTTSDGKEVCQNCINDYEAKKLRESQLNQSTKDTYLKS